MSPVHAVQRQEEQRSMPFCALCYMGHIRWTTKNVRFHSSPEACKLAALHQGVPGRAALYDCRCFPKRRSAQLAVAGRQRERCNALPLSLSLTGRGWPPPCLGRRSDGWAPAWLRRIRSACKRCVRKSGPAKCVFLGGLRRGDQGRQALGSLGLRAQRAQREAEGPTLAAPGSAVKNQTCIRGRLQSSPSRIVVAL